MRISIAIVLSLLLYNCSRKLDDTTSQTDSLADSVAIAEIPYDELFALKTYLDNSMADTSQIQSISAAGVVFVIPTEEQMAEMSKEYGEDDFFAIADDATFYQGTAIGLLDSLKVTTVAAKKQYIRFAGARETWTLNMKKKGLPEWNLVFFHPEKAPEVVPAIDVTAERIKEYFEVPGF